MLSELNNLCWNKKIEVLIILNNWTQKQAAEKCNTTQKMYWNWEKGLNYPRKNSQISIANAFNVKVDEIFPI